MADEKSFGPVRFIPGVNGARYPFCNSVYIEGAGILIDPASDRERLTRLRDGPGVNEVWLSHWHEDHIMHLDLFEDKPLVTTGIEAPPLSDLETFMAWYGMVDEKELESWRKTMTDTFHYKPRTPARFFEPGGKIGLGEVTVEVLHTPGHTPGHLSYFFQEPGVLFMGDYDLTRFGPWYGDVGSSIDDTIESVKRLRKVPAQVWMTGHEHGLFEDDPGELWDDYLAVIDTREEKLAEYLSTGPKTIGQVIEQWIVYGRPREPREFFEFGERAIMGKHLARMVEKGEARKEGDHYFIET